MKNAFYRLKLRFVDKIDYKDVIVCILSLKTVISSSYLPNNSNLMYKSTTMFLSVILYFNINGTTTNTNTANTTSVEQNTNNTEPKIIHNADVGIFPGSSDNGRLMVSKGMISPADITRDFIVTGLQAADHGKEIVLYATIGSIELLANNLNSSSNNRIAQSSNMKINQGQFAELTYNSNIGKWVITNIE